MDQKGEFDVGLLSVGQLSSCFCAYLCCPCALASARSHMDDSSYVFNLACLPVCCIPPVRWMIRTGYDIPGDAWSDCYLSFFCPCCVLNQLLQTAHKRGNTSILGGHDANIREFNFFFGACSSDPVSCIYSSVCCPCSTGNSLHTALGMPFVFGCCCMTPCAARNVLRYQYRLRGDDISEELLGPIAASVALYGLFVTPLMLLPIISSYSNQIYNEVQYRGKSMHQRYLVPLPSTGRPPPQLPRSLLPHTHMDLGDSTSEISSVMASSFVYSDSGEGDKKVGGVDDEHAPLLSPPIFSSSSSSSSSVPAAAASHTAAASSSKKEKIAVAKPASSKDRKMNYIEAEADAATLKFLSSTR